MYRTTHPAQNSREALLGGAAALAVSAAAFLCWLGLQAWQAACESAWTAPVVSLAAGFVIAGSIAGMAVLLIWLAGEAFDWCHRAR
jgi:hypothetical protein